MVRAAQHSGRAPALRPVGGRQLRTAVTAHVVEGAQAPVVAPNDEHRLAGDVAQEPVAGLGSVGGPTDDRPLPGEDAFSLECPGRSIALNRRRSGRLRRAELESDHEAEPADVVEHLVPLAQGLRRGFERPAGLGGAFDDVLVVEGGERRQSGDHGELVATERGRVLECLLDRAVDASEDLVRREHGAHRDVSTRQCLRHRDDVGLEIPVLVREELSRAAETGLHLVDHEQGLVAVAQLLGRVPVVGRRHVNAFALDWLDDERGRRALGELSLQRVDVAEGHRDAVGKERSETFAELLATVERECAGAQAVEAVLGVDDAGASGGLPSELDRRFDCLGSRVAEERPVDPAVGPADELLGEETGKQRAVHLHHVGKVEIDGLVQRGLDRRMAAAEGVDAESGQEIEILLAAVVVEVAALAAHVVPIEAQGLEHPGELQVQVLLMQREVLAVPRFECASHVERHLAPPRHGEPLARLRLAGRSHHPVRHERGVGQRRAVETER